MSFHLLVSYHSLFLKLKIWFSFVIASDHCRIKMGNLRVDLITVFALQPSKQSSKLLLQILALVEYALQLPWILNHEI